MLKSLPLFYEQAWKLWGFVLLFVKAREFTADPLLCRMKGRCPTCFGTNHSLSHVQLLLSLRSLGLSRALKGSPGGMRDECSRSRLLATILSASPTSKGCEGPNSCRFPLPGRLRPTGLRPQYVHLRVPGGGPCTRPLSVLRSPRSQ